MKALFLLVSLVIFCANSSAAGTFSAGPLISEHGKHAKVEYDLPLPADTRLKVVFDVAERTAEKKLNRSFESLARFLNMHVANGIPAQNIELALVVHGKAGFDLLNDSSYRKMAEIDNPNAALVARLLEHNVKIYICGQSAAYIGIPKGDLLPGVKMALSAMTAHALLQNDGYKLNPF